MIFVKERADDRIFQISCPKCHSLLSYKLEDVFKNKISKLDDSTCVRCIRFYEEEVEFVKCPCCSEIIRPTYKQIY